MNFQRFLYSDVGKIIISILLGLGLSTLFRKACNNRNCITFNGPKLSDIEKKVYKFDDKCYTFKTHAETCSVNKKQVDFA